MISNTLHGFSNTTIAVIGDVMIDAYLAGVIERISPEAPVPVVRAQSMHTVPGGAANVAANVAALEGRALLVGVVGHDEGRELIATLAALGCHENAGLVVDPDRQTIRKQRIMAGQQVVRIDFEDTHPLSPEIETKLIDQAMAAIEAADVVVLSDYGKGVLTPAVIAAVNGAAARMGKVVIVDPKRKDLSAYRGATILTPNRSELTAATGLPCEHDEEAALAAARATEIFGGAILLTRSEKGLSYYAHDGQVSHYPAMAREVFDVSGAGDTVVATLATALAAGVEMDDAIRIANHAAGIVVAKTGTATVSLEELRVTIAAADAHSASQSQLATLKMALAQCRQWQQSGLKVGLANGCFDLLHPGHIALIRQAAASCDRLIMALNTDASVKRLKGPTRPVQSQDARAEVMGAIKGVDLVVLFDEDTPLELITALKPDVLVKGSDYTLDRVVGADIVLERGGKVVLADLIAGQSTTRIIAAAGS